MKTEDIRIRDPYVLPYGKFYYMYGTSSNWENEDALYVYKSLDLENWSDPIEIFRLKDDTWAKGQLWAPEVYLYNNKFYMFLSLLGKHDKRGTQVFVCDTPDGMFKALTDKPITPYERSCIDGTLYIENDTPYVVYSGDWPDNYDAEGKCYIGEIWAVELTEDLREVVGEPFRLFRSTDSPYSSSKPAVYEYKGEVIAQYGSDGPFLSRLSNGNLFLTWSPIPNLNYIVAAAVSENGIKGEWRHVDNVFENNGGHAMFFEDFDGNKMMSIHYPENPPYERALFLPVTEENGVLKLHGDKQHIK